MGNRLSKIVTRTGDDGTTGLGDGSRVEKDHIRVAAFGTVDELNSIIGVLLAHAVPKAIHTCLIHTQNDLFDVGAELSIPGYTIIDEQDVERLEQDLERFNDELPPLKEFILPGGGEAAATCHLARTVCRRAERQLVALTKQESVNQQTLIYLNRLSDLLFVIARVLTRVADEEEILWQPKDQRKKNSRHDN